MQALRNVIDDTATEDIEMDAEEAEVFAPLEVDGLLSCAAFRGMACDLTLGSVLPDKVS